ncbi:hypothetical protein PUN28_012189 [Cardiocondyla obscurior]|uniref:Uncharacterized protein n=1 Tax=Cardiocondyla obscurior TaxID=286306 RepID=A0AAW2FF39_9HYME
MGILFNMLLSRDWVAWRSSLGKHHGVTNGVSDDCFTTLRKVPGPVAESAVASGYYPPSSSRSEFYSQGEEALRLILFAMDVRVLVKHDQKAIETGTFANALERYQGSPYIRSRFPAWIVRILASLEHFARFQILYAPKLSSYIGKLLRYWRKIIRQQ